MRWVGHVACMAAKINAYKIFIEKPERKILFEISKCRYKGNFQICFKETRREDIDWIYFTFTY
jgi:hypothetical protein